MTNQNAGTMTGARLMALIYCDAYEKPDFYAPVVEDMLLKALDETERAKWLQTMPMYEAQRRLEAARGEREANRRYFDAVTNGQSTEGLI